MKLVICEQFDEENRPVWKNSILPMIYASSRFVFPATAGVSSTIESMENAAKDTEACLYPADKHWELVIKNRQLPHSYN
jgi:hypothetical protein